MMREGKIIIRIGTYLEMVFERRSLEKLENRSRVFSGFSIILFRDSLSLCGRKLRGSEGMEMRVTENRAPAAPAEY